MPPIAHPVGQQHTRSPCGLPAAHLRCAPHGRAPELTRTMPLRCESPFRAHDWQNRAPAQIAPQPEKARRVRLVVPKTHRGAPAASALAVPARSCRSHGALATSRPLHRRRRDPHDALLPRSVRRHRAAWPPAGSAPPSSAHAPLLDAPDSLQPGHLWPGSGATHPGAK